MPPADVVAILLELCANPWLELLLYEIRVESLLTLVPAHASRHATQVKSSPSNMANVITKDRLWY